MGGVCGWGLSGGCCIAWFFGGREGRHSEMSFLEIDSLRSGGNVPYDQEESRTLYESWVELSWAVEVLFAKLLSSQNVVMRY